MPDELNVIPVPTERQQTAHALRKKGLSDAKVGKALGISRESANRLIAGFNRKIAELRTWCTQHRDFSLLASFDL